MVSDKMYPQSNGKLPGRKLPINPYKEILDKNEKPDTAETPRATKAEHFYREGIGLVRPAGFSSGHAFVSTTFTLTLAFAEVGHKRKH
ncbi:hypothetical protein PoB_002053100 [Plakobranchus ocellatus]|uniref:Uncharacterized protein n=1 Tax=Plakobranchus ocellatus TaxID=259542 RepID=A0AAV3Z3Z6_9GAST|nr:hypothetical protein PoB_002053100 [Plakobranchus ocellatus]